MVKFIVGIILFVMFKLWIFYLGRIEMKLEVLLVLKKIYKNIIKK